MRRIAQRIASVELRCILFYDDLSVTQSAENVASELCAERQIMWHGIGAAIM